MQELTFMSDTALSHGRILTGIQPTGEIHLGNYVGALKPFMASVDAAKDCFIFIADYHALNMVRDRAHLKDATYKIAATYLALGLDQKKVAFYRQSDVSEIFELTTILSAITPKGLMNRAHAYKAAVDRNTALGKQGADLDDGINMGLYTYPILMAADMLIADADIIPVGKDQIQHVEMARDIAGSFNHLFGETLVLPTYKVQEGGTSIPGLDGQKMSKSYNNTIPLFDQPNRRKKLIMKIITDSKLPEESKDPDQSTIFQLYTQFASADEIQEMRQAFEQGGMGYGEAKKRLAVAVDRELEAPTEAYHEWLANPAELDAVLEEGAARAGAIAKETIGRVREAIGIVSR
jgi:tryptophanyl-tRNA synthetase